jgi:hypothetical protein
MPYPVSGKRGMRPASRLQPSPQDIQCDKIPAAIAGINAVSNIAELGPNDAVSLFNLIPGQYGLRVRTGYQEWCTNVGSNGVRTIIPFNGSIAAEDRLFAAAEDGIYEVSSSTDTPTQLIAFPSSDDESGYGQWANFTTVGGNFSLYCDETNGYYTWDETPDTWSKIAAGTAAGEIDGVDPADLVSVTIYKNRAWFVRRNSATAYYLPPGYITGRATEFNFGNKFKTGGYLKNLYTWTLDSEGLNSFLVAISSSGDVVVYEGDDPDTPGSFRLRGVWFIGPPPAGRRIGGSFGGELYLLSAYGVIPISKLISGRLVQDTDIYLTRRITPLINADMRLFRSFLGWEVRLVPTENLILVSVPLQEGYPEKQYVQSINSEGWAVYRDIPYFTGDTWRGNFYIGTEDGRVLVHTGNLDNVLISDPNDFSQIEWSGIMGFRDYGDTGTYNRAAFIRPVFMAQQPPSYAVEARFDYDISEVLAPPAASDPSGALWDVAVWDVDVWGGDFQIIDGVKGAAGIGRSIAIAINGMSASETILLRFDFMGDSAQLTL